MSEEIVMFFLAHPDLAGTQLIGLIAAAWSSIVVVVCLFRIAFYYADKIIGKERP